MRSLSRAALIAAAAALLPSCETYEDKIPRSEQIKAASAPCAEPGGLRDPAPPAPVNEVEYGTSPKARRQRQNGCAGVRFKIDRDGTARDATLIVEQPPGFGFGQATLEGLAQTLYDPAAAKAAWYYYVSVFLPKPPEPVRPPP